jgi:putative sterol carrier protein
MIDHDQISAAQDALDRVRRISFLSDFAAPFPTLMESEEDSVDQSFQRMGDLATQLQEPVSVAFRITTGEEKSYCVLAGPEGMQVTDEAQEAPEVEVILDADTWKRMASGSISPLEAFGIGKMRVRGDINAAWRFARGLQVAGSEHDGSC